ncbi:hypothetical protein [Bradyrhizobium sp. SZCCHNR2009]|uniref:hypothetical protein n=1 Tax=Bradyrhizobium sp. SZCCHNR2009 TaxID=3057375 RepID=UPI0028F1090E|nr:hypothetical protein [Bradyrhizobium sp. SZCCHNR2009]
MNEKPLSSPRLFLATVSGGIGVITSLNAFTDGYVWIAVMFAALSSIVLTASWFDFAALGRLSQQLADVTAEADESFAIAGSRSADAVFYLKALVDAREALYNRRADLAAEIVSDTVVSFERCPGEAARLCTGWLASINAAHAQSQDSTPQPAGDQ